MTPSIIFISFIPSSLLFYFFFFNDRATPEIYPLPLHDALPISASFKRLLGVTALASAAVSRHQGSTGRCRRPAAETIRDRCPPLRAPNGPWGRQLGRKPGRSEEHTSELQSQSNLVCRLLLEKKN